MSLKTGCQEEGRTGPHREAPGQEAGEGHWAGASVVSGGRTWPGPGSAVWGLLLVLWPLGGEEGEGEE